LDLEVALYVTEEPWGVESLADRVMVMIGPGHLNAQDAFIKPYFAVLVRVYRIALLLQGRLRCRSCQSGTGQQ
jgi:hypothetical protein